MDAANTRHEHDLTATRSESLVIDPRGTGRDTAWISSVMEDDSRPYFRQVRRRYGAFEGSLRGVDSTHPRGAGPGGMLTNLESQLREQNAADKLDEVLAEDSQGARRPWVFVPR